jgi:hypothetical protein
MNIIASPAPTRTRGDRDGHEGGDGEDQLSGRHRQRACRDQNAPAEPVEE